jgi:hypothetical protein
MKIVLAVGVMAAMGCTACCQPVQRKLMDPLPSAEQIWKVNERADLVQSMRIRGRVTIKWQDKDGHAHDDSADGSLLFRRRAGGAGGPVAYDTVLFARALSKDIFELGENEKFYWMALRVDPPTATVVEKDKFDWAPNNSIAAEIPLRAATVPLALGLAPVDGSRRAAISVSGGEGVQQRAVALTNLTQVEVISFIGGAPLSALVLSRYEPGDPEAVRLYRPDGVIEGEATLADYRNVVTRQPGGEPDDEPVPGPTMRLPFKVHVEYPGRKATVDLAVESYEVNLPMRDVTFKMPDFGKQGLEVKTIKGGE